MFPKYYKEKIFPLEKSYQEDKDWNIFQDICYRAYNIISQYEDEEINKQAQVARNYLLTVDALSESLQNGFIDLIPDAKNRGILNLSYAYRIKHGYPIFGSEKFNVEHWDLLFALIALYEIDTCMMVQKTINSGRISYPNYHKRENYQVYALSALEAVTFAENSKTTAQEIESKVKENISQKARKAALKKHEKRRSTYNRFINFYNYGTFNSKSSAADKFLESVKGEDIGLVPTNAKRSLLDALRKHEKSLNKFK